MAGRKLKGRSEGGARGDSDAHGEDSSATLT